jgi:hypothetical protein
MLGDTCDTCQHVLGALLQCRHFTHEARGGGRGRCGRVDVGAVHSCSLEVRAVHSFHLTRSHLSLLCIFIIFKCVFCVFAFVLSGGGLYYVAARTMGSFPTMNVSLC